MQANNLWFRYRRSLPWVLEGASIDLPQGEVTGLFGPSGSGKSTLGRVLGGLLQPERGVVDVSTERTPTGGWPVQMVVQHPERAIDPRWSIREVLAETGATDESIERIERAFLEPAWIDRFPHELSGGELQRINIARALLAQPRYLIADEITASLDPLLQAHVWQMLLEHVRAQNITMLVISHHRDLLERVCDRVVRFNAGTSDAG